jgi:polyhydroxyalkanoate synthesis regulator phasin
METDKLAFFSNHKIRRLWDDKQEKWYFSVVDVVGALANNKRPRKYWDDLKRKLKNEGSEVSEKIGQFKIIAEDGKMRESDMADTETIFRLIQSIPSPNAEPFKLWLARVGYERVEEVHDPELAIQRSLNTYLKKGYSPEWVNLRLKSIEIRKDLTNEWVNRGIKTGNEFAILTDDITFAWAGLKIKDYKDLKNLKKESLRDNMTNLELVLNMLAEVSTTKISEAEQPETFEDNRQVAKKGGDIAGHARKELEKRIGKDVISRDNYLDEPQSRKRLGKSLLR